MDKIPIRHIHVTQKEPDFSESFSIRNIEPLMAQCDMVQELHRHDFFYILALEKGTGNHEIDFTPYEICDHSVFLMRPGQVHRLILKTGSKGYLLQFRNDFHYPYDKVSNQLLRKASHINCYQFNENRFQKTLSILTCLFQEYTDKKEQYQEVIKANLNIFFIELIRQQGKSLLKNVNPYMQERLDEFSDLLETHVFNYKQVSQYAEMLNLSNYQLNAITKATLGKTCSELINEHVILESKRHILATSDQVNQLAYHLGFQDVSYFIRFFKKHTGSSPEEFRHNSDKSY
ncbi:AraC family transcriptional regulator [Pedobacter sp. NJ-S-72]